MKRTFLPLILFSVLLFTAATDKPAYRLFNEKGKERKYEDLLQDALKADIILFGEQHTSPVCHWLQIEMARDLHREVSSRLILGSEIFESDDQLILNEYLNGTIRTKNFEEEAKLWKNYATDYKALVEFARSNQLRFVASNIPRRYAALVSRNGLEALDSLPPSARSLLPPLPIAYDPEQKVYKEMIEMDSLHTSPNLPKAQAVKDAAMAHNLLQSWSSGQLLLHINGSLHSENREGIVWYLKKESPELRILTIATVEQEDIAELDEKHQGIADYILLIPENFPTSR